LLRLSRAHKTPRKLAERATMILLSSAGTGVREIARRLDVWPKTVRLWRARWLATPPGTTIAVRLADEPRPGAPATFTPEQVAWLERIRDHLAASLGISAEDFAYTPFVEHGGLGKAGEVFGSELDPLLKELSEALAV